MARVANVNIPDNKRVIISLTYVHGIGLPRAKKICDAVGIEESLRVKDLADEKLVSLREYIDKNYVVEGDLRQAVAKDIKKKKDIKCYAGLRHRRSLPVRGQNTHSNARTRKGKRAIAVAGKKMPKK